MGKPDGTASSAKKQRADTVTGRKDELDALRENWSGSATGYQKAAKPGRATALRYCQTGRGQRIAMEVTRGGGSERPR